MILTDSAKEVIVKIMKNQDLDPTIFALNFSKPQFSEGFGICFCKDEIGKTLFFGELRVIVSYDMDVSKLIIDTEEKDGTKYLIFKGE